MTRCTHFSLFDQSNDVGNNDRRSAHSSERLNELNIGFDRFVFFFDRFKDTRSIAG